MTIRLHGSAHTTPRIRAAHAIQPQYWGWQAPAARRSNACLHARQGRNLVAPGRMPHAGQRAVRRHERPR